MYEPNIVELAGIKYRVLSFLPFSSLLSVTTLVLYLGYRIKFIVAAYKDGGDLNAILNSCWYFITELGMLLPGLLNHFLRCMAFHGHDKAPHLRLLNKDNLPRVDIFLTCAGEEPDMVENTAAAACAIDYPAKFFRVIVLDDAHSDDLSALIEKLRKSRPNLYYTARVKGKNHHFKAGNLNHGVKFVESLPGGPAEYIAALDADMIPDPQWLRALLPHMIKNPKASLAQPPQRFYDVPTSDPLLQGLDVNFKVVEPLKEAMSSTWCGGSGYVLRREALEDIGGFPTESVGEDMYCSNVLLGKGWQTIYVDETLQIGRVPESYKAHVKQQSRWHVGRVQTAIAMRFYLYGSHSHMMGTRQRIIGLIYVLLSLCSLLTTLGMATLLLSLASGLPIITYSKPEDLIIQLRLICAATLAEHLDDFITAFIIGYRIAISEGHINYWIAPYHALALVRAFLPNAAFEFTASGSSSEPQSSSRKSLFSPHLIYILFLSLAIARSALPSFNQPFPHLLVYALWPPLVHVLLLISFTVPIRCAVHPPTIPNRSQLLKRDPMRRANYPDGVEETGGTGWGGKVAVVTAVVGYTLGLGMWSLFLKSI